MVAVPERVSLEGLEPKWGAWWEEHGVHRYTPGADRSRVFSVDTPPPTVSGQLHLGTVFGYVQVDAVVRFHRMRGDEVFYPIGWDDNGLPTERRVQHHFGVRCDPSLPYDPDLVVPDPDDPAKAVSRANFLQLCHQLTALDEQQFEEVFRRVGLSVDWTLAYATIDDHCRRVAQLAFVRNLARGQAYAAEAPTLWDVDFQTAVAQAELEDRTTTTQAHRVRFDRVDGGTVEIETTRPELLPACVALVVHPDDARHAALVGTEVTSPVFGVRVPVLAHRLADPDKGTGVVMVCTFGDTVDVIWWRELGLPMRSIVRRDGTLVVERPEWLGPDADQAWQQVAGRGTAAARRAVVALLGEAGALAGEPRSVQHEVRFYEKGDRPLEIVASRQWYIRNGAHQPELRSALLDAGRRLEWHPPHMRVRYEHWVEGLNTDWLVSRQRFFGVPFPVWYPVGDDGQVRYDEPIVADEASLPVDPQASPPPGFDEAQRGVPGGFVGDPDVMDTWATSSLTPLIACGWETHPERFAATFPMDLRPQGPEIIRTWLFSTVLRSHFERDTLPWRNVTINGWILDPDRKKMSKSKGNVVTPSALVDEFGADGVRYWACSAAPGTDTAVDRAQMRVGRRLAIKLLNVSKFVLGLAGGASGGPASAADGSGGAAADGTGGAADGTGGAADGSGGAAADGSTGAAAAHLGDGGDVTEAVDRALLARLAGLVEVATAAFERFEHQRALERTEAFFWGFCDDYLELVKGRAYGDGAPARSARAALALSLGVLTRLLAPFLPFAAEEAWSWWHEDSVHRAPWPTTGELAAGQGADERVLDVAADVLGAVRKAKTAAQRGMRTPVERLRVVDAADRLAALVQVADDIRQAGVVADLVTAEGEPAQVDVELAPVPADAGS
jgi:valyl-tRNA synthetase